LTIQDVLKPANADPFFAADGPLSEPLRTRNNGKSPIKETSA
jgi:hypothetical protein